MNGRVPQAAPSVRRTESAAPEKLPAAFPDWFRDALQSPKLTGLVGRLEQGAVLSLHGVAEAGKPLVMSLLAAATGRTLCVLAASVRQQEQLHSDLTALGSVCGGEILHFPEMESPASGSATPDLEIGAEMLDALRRLQRPAGSRVVVATDKAAAQPVPSPAALTQSTRALRVGGRIAMDPLAGELAALGYEREAQVEGRGQFARRGGILDFFPLQGDSAVRLEFNGDEIESIRRFDVETQGSVGAITEVEFSGVQILRGVGDPSSLRDYLPGRHILWREPSDPVNAVELQSLSADDREPDGTAQMALDPNDPSAKQRVSAGDGFTPSRVRRAGGDKPLPYTLPPSVTRPGPLQADEADQAVTLDIFGHAFLAPAALDTVLREQRHDLLLRHWRDWLNEGYRLVVCCNNEGEERRLRQWISEGTADGARLVTGALWLQAPLLRGFLWPAARLAVLSDAEVFGRYQTLRLLRLQQKTARARARREVMDFSRFNEGDLVVHVNHGIGRFLGIQKVAVAGREQEVLTLEYHGDTRLHVPVEQAHLVGRYVGVGKAVVKLDELGGARWGKAAAQAQRAVMDYAADLLRIEAERKARPGFAFAPDNEWQKEFEDSFLFDETPDQVTAIADTKADMESAKPMDRLICGDVGFGKTEVAIRAAFKAVMNGKQVAVLAPTTVLAQQHERTFRERMADYPARIDLLSRFRSKAEQRRTIAATRAGTVDILIGTHRLLQPDVVFKDLGLVIVDEEQRFGVKHKERFKQIFSLLDVLTLSATPIPRTLYLSLVGAKDISTIETPPLNRLPVETMIAPHDERLIRSAIERELARGGQVFFLHNRVGSIQRVRDRIVDLVPHARVEIGHGQMDEDELEEVMLRFVEGQIDVLVATTIIESGLDIPRANTIIIDRADRFGLADLYQLRGRVGRGQLKAYAYLLLPRHLMIEPQARERVSAIKQYSHLGAGFKVAMRDLEIRGAGNVLGTEQSGHATAIGFELYCQLLKETLARMKGEPAPPRVEVRVRLDFLPMSEDHAPAGIGAYIPRVYMSESRERITAYRKLAEATDETRLRALLEQWRDRYGKPPRPVLWLIELARIRLAAAGREITSVDVEDNRILMQKGGQYLTVGGRFPRLDAPGRTISTRVINARLKQVRGLALSLGDSAMNRK